MQSNCTQLEIEIGTLCWIGDHCQLFLYPDDVSAESSSNLKMPASEFKVNEKIMDMFRLSETIHVLERKLTRIKTYFHPKTVCIIFF